MKIELPLETWTELFGSVPRSQLKQLVPHNGEETRKRDNQGRKCHQTIGDRQFVKFVQFYLHKCGEVILRQLHLCSFRNAPAVFVNGRGPELPLAVVPIPDNVKDFESIRLSIFGNSAIAFLQKFQQNSLLDNVNLCFYYCSDLEIIEIMTNILPLFTSVNSVEIGSDNSSDLLDQLQNEYSDLAMPMLASTRVLLADYNRHDFWYCDWLKTLREDGKPRDFLEANQAVSFFIQFDNFRDAASVQSLTLENGQTQEKLVIKTAKENDNTVAAVVTISRCPMGMDEEELVEYPNFDNRRIEL